jgi:hypothetical protein
MMQGTMTQDIYRRATKEELAAQVAEHRELEKLSNALFAKVASLIEKVDGQGEKLDQIWEAVVVAKVRR